MNIEINPLKFLLRYVVEHWYGRQSLTWSFWVNLVALRILVFTLQTIVTSGTWSGYVPSREYVVFAVIAFHGLLLLWQIVGVVRAAEVHFAVQGNMALVWGAQLACVLLFLLSSIYSLEAYQMIVVIPTEQDPLVLMEKKRASQYSLSLDSTQFQLSIDGSIELGITKAVRQLLNNHPSIEQIYLNSVGGNIYEARGLAKLFKTHKLDTHNKHICASACTVAFVGGLNRSIGLDAKFGFHQYRVAAEYSIIVTDVDKEQDRDAALFLEAGVSKAFVRVMYDQGAQAMWWPSVQELLQAGYIHEQY